MADTSKRKRSNSSYSPPDPPSKRSRPTCSPDIPGEISSENVVTDSTVEKTVSNPNSKPAICQDGIQASFKSDIQSCSSAGSLSSSQDEDSTQIIREDALGDCTSEKDLPKAAVSVDDDACPSSDVQNMGQADSTSDTSQKAVLQSAQDSSHQCSRNTQEECHTNVGEDRKSTDNVNRESTKEIVPTTPGCDGTQTYMASLDTVDMEAVQALTFLKQSASPTKVISATLSNQRKGDTRLYTGSIRRKGFAKGSLAKQKLKKNSQKKLTPVHSDETDSENQQDGFSSSPSRMVIDMQPTRKSARQAAQEDKEKPWSAMMKRKAKKKLGKMFEMGPRVDEAGGERKETRGRKKGSKGPSLDADEVQRANEACDLLEKRLEENAAKNNLSVVNVKNILHHVITNEHVLAMVRNTMDDETPGDHIKAPSSPTVFEPKMTRSKLKEVSEKSGNVPFVWPVSPIKKSKQAPQFTDLNFSDSDDDEDYKPSQEDLQKDESDYESLTSFGSPCPSTPRSSLNTSFFEDTEEEGEVETAPPGSPSHPPTMSPSPAKGGHLRAVPVPMGPPPPRPRCDNKLKDDAKFLKQLDEVNMELEKSEDTIAHRTRSKFPITIPLEEIEASFVAPDITADMFDTWDDCEDDNEWVRWLAGLQKTTDTEVSDAGDDDQNDPEYNFLAEEEAVDEEDFRNDRTVQITKKELNELLDELIDAFESEDWATDFDMKHFDRPQQLTLSDMIAQRQMAYPKNAKEKKNVPHHQQSQQQQVLVFNNNERLQLQQQMQQHVQLLCQLNILCRSNTALEPHKNQAKQFLSELDMLAGRSEETVMAPYVIPGVQQPYAPRSAFRPCNLAGALVICDQEFPVTEKELSCMNASEAWKSVANEANRSKSQTIRSPPTEGAQKIIAHSRVFMYSELLPTVSLTEKPLQKIIFEKAEDKLIILGLMQFPVTNDRQVQYRLICQNMLPIKTHRQVMVHIKNMCFKKRNIDNIIRKWRKNNILPDLIPLCAPVVPGTEQAPIEQSQLYDKKPEWIKRFMYKARFFPQTPTVTETPATSSCPSSTASPPVQQLLPPEGKPHTLTNSTSVITIRSITKPISAPKRAILPKVTSQSTQGKVDNPSKLSSSETDSSPKPRTEGHQRPSAMLTQSCRIAPKAKAVSCVTLQSNSANQPVLMIQSQPGVMDTIEGTAAVQIITQSSLSPSVTLVNPTADTKSSESQTLKSTPRSRSKVSPTRVTPSGISALQNFKVRRLDNVSPEPPLVKDVQCHEDKSATNIKRQSESAEVLKSASKQTTKLSTSKGHSKTGNKTSSAHEQSKKESVSNSNNQDAMKQTDSNKNNSTATASTSAPPTTQSSTTSTTVTTTDKKCSNTSSEFISQKELTRPPSRSKSRTPDSLPEEEDEDDNLREVVSPVDVLESGNSNSQDFGDSADRPDGPQSLGQGEGETEETAEELEKTTLYTKMAAKRMKSKLRKDLESTVVLLNSNIVSKDPKRKERETSFSRAYLNKVKERFSSEPDRYIDFLGIFNSFSQSQELPVDELYHKICEVLDGNSDLIEDFTAFLPPDVALACGVLMENLEFAKARLFLRQVEVHFQKNPSQFQKVLSTITEWGGKENRTNNELKENIFPLLKSQPHLEQEFSLLFPDERPPDNYMMDFEEIVLDDEKEKEYDSFEEIEIPDSDEEIPITKSRVGRPPNKPPSSTQPPPGPRASSLHGFLPNAKAALLKGRLPSILKSTSGGKRSASRQKSQALDPWQELNAHLQYGTQGCKCNCHEKSHDSRVQRKVRHCAYCSAMVTRTELISSLRGLTIANRRRGHLLSGSQQPGTSEDAAQRNSKRGSGRNPSGRKAPKVQWAVAEGEEQEMEEEEEEEEQNPYSDAVAHLSEICANLADYLNENASLSEEDEEEEKEFEDDDANDDAEDGQEEDDDYEDMEDEDEQDDKPEDDDEDEDDGGDDAVITSEESHGLDGATPESSISPVMSQGSRESCLSGDSSSSRHTPQPTQLTSSQTTLLGSGVILEGNGSRANSPVTYAEDERSTEEHMKELKSCLAKEKGEETLSNPSSVRSLPCHEILSESPVRHFSAICESSGQTVGSVSIPDMEKKEEKFVSQSDSSLKDSNSPPVKSPHGGVTEESTDQVGAGEKSETLLPRKHTIRRVKTVRPTHIPDVPFGRTKPVSLFESLTKSKLSPKEGDALEYPCQTKILKTEPQDDDGKHNVEGCNAESDHSEEPLLKKQHPEECKTKPIQTISKEEAALEDSPRMPEMPKNEEDSRADQEKASGTSSLLSAANVARRKDGEVVVVWTRDADRLLLQRCRDQGATEEVFEEVAKILGDKTSEQVEQRFNTLMKLFQSATRNTEEDEDEDSEEDVSEDEDNDQQESDTQDVDNG